METEELFNQLVTYGIIQLLDAIKDKPPHYCLSDGNGQKWIDTREWKKTDFTHKNKIEERFPGIVEALDKSPEGVGAYPSHGHLNSVLSGDRHNILAIRRLLRIMILVEEKNGATDPCEKLLQFFLSRYPLRKNLFDSLEKLEGWWASFHNSYLADTNNNQRRPVLVKGILSINPKNQISYRVYEPKMGEEYLYTGIATLEESTIVLRLMSQNDNLKETLTFRLLVGDIDPDVPIRKVPGIVSGITKSKEPLASKVCITRSGFESFHAKKEGAFPVDGVSFSDEDEICDLISDSKDFFAYGPKSSRVHRRWTLSNTERVTKAVERLPANSSLDILATSVPLSHRFEKTAKRLFTDRSDLGLRVIMCDPRSEIFILRNAHRFSDPETFKGALDRQLRVYLSICEIVGQQRPSNRVERALRFTQSWISGLGFLAGRQNLFLGSFSTTKFAYSGHQIEIRDPENATLNNFRRDFDYLWDDEQQLSYSLDLEALDQEEIIARWIETKKRISQAPD